jgi:hypothetical protein
LAEGSDREKNWLIIVLRLIHIVAGVFWIGGSVITTFFVGPAAAATGEAGQQFLVRLVRNLNFVQRCVAAAGLTVLAGGALYWIDSHGLTSSWMFSGPGWGFALGALFAIVGFAFGIRVGRITRQLAGTISAIQGKPTEGQVLERDRSQRQAFRLRLVQDSLLILALACMATARYWGR